MWDSQVLWGVASVFGGLMATLPAQAKQPHARLEGRVLDPRSQPVVNAEVTVAIKGEVVARTRSDAEGTFVLGRVPMAEVTVRATTASPDLGACRVDLREDTRGFANLVVVPARVVTGTVLDDQGQPIAQAWVATVPTGAAEFSVFGSHTRSDEQGRFLLTHVPFGANAVRAWAAGHAGFAGSIDGNGKANVAAVLGREDTQEHTFELADSTAEQRRAAQCTVSVTANEAEVPLPPELRHPTLSDDQHWHVQGWPHDDAMHVHLELASNFLEPSVLHIAAGIENRHKLFYLDSDEEVVARGQLVAGEGIAAGGRELLALAMGGRSSCTTRPDGSFELRSPVVRGGYFLLHCADKRFALRRPAPRGWRPEAPLRSSVPCKHIPSKTLQLQLVPAAIVKLVVHDGNGQPCHGAAVTLLSKARQEVTFGTVQGATFLRHEAEVYARGFTAADGSLELAGLDLDEGEMVVCQISGLQGFLEREFAIEGVATNASRMHDLGEVRPGPAASLHGTVVDADGKPVPGARMRIENWSGHCREQLVVSDRDGQFLLRGLMPGACIVERLGSRLKQQCVLLQANEQAEIEVH
jgi:hypothetical protein